MLKKRSYKDCELRAAVKLSKSSYHAKKNHKTPQQQERKNRFKKEIFNIYYEFKSVYGAPKIHAILKQRNVDEGVIDRTVSVYMHEMSLK